MSPLECPLRMSTSVADVYKRLQFAGVHSAPANRCAPKSRHTEQAWHSAHEAARSSASHKPGTCRQALRTSFTHKLGILFTRSLRLGHLCLRPFLHPADAQVKCRPVTRSPCIDGLQDRREVFLDVGCPACPAVHQPHRIRTILTSHTVVRWRQSELCSELKKTNKKKQIGHHARHRRASATAPLRTGADTCKTGSGAGKRAGAKSDPVRRRSNHAWTEDQAGKRRCANTDAVGGLRVPR